MLIMTKKKKKDIPFHIAHNYKHYELTGGGVKFWAKDESDARLYCDKVGKSGLNFGYNEILLRKK